jgi:hypothetical protein
VTHTHVGMGMGVNSYPPVYMGDPVGLFFCRGYEYGVVIPGGYLPIAISTLRANRPPKPPFGLRDIFLFYLRKTRETSLLLAAEF